MRERGEQSEIIVITRQRVYHKGDLANLMEHSSRYQLIGGNHDGKGLEHE